MSAPERAREAGVTCLFCGPRRPRTWRESGLCLAHEQAVTRHPSQATPMSEDDLRWTATDEADFRAWRANAFGPRAVSATEMLAELVAEAEPDLAPTLDVPRWENVRILALMAVTGWLIAATVLGVVWHAVGAL